MRPTCPRCLCRLARAHGAVQSPRMILPESTPHARSPIPRQIRGIYTSKVDFARAALRRSIDPDTSASTSTRTSIITNRRTPPPLEGTSDGSRWDEPKDIDVVAEQTPEMGLVPEGLESWHVRPSNPHSHSYIPLRQSHYVPSDLFFVSHSPCILGKEDAKLGYRILTSQSRYYTR